MGMHCLPLSNAGAVCYTRLSPVNTHTLPCYLFDSVGIWGEGLVLIARNSNAFSKSGHGETEWFLASTERTVDKCKGLLRAVRAKGCDEVQLLAELQCPECGLGKPALTSSSCHCAPCSWNKADTENPAFESGKAAQSQVENHFTCV